MRYLVLLLLSHLCVSPTFVLESWIPTYLHGVSVTAHSFASQSYQKSQALVLAQVYPVRFVNVTVAEIEIMLSLHVSVPGI